MNLLTLSFNSSSMAFRMSPIVVFVAPSDFSHCLVLTHCDSPAPSLVSVDAVVIVPVVPVAMVPWPLFGTCSDKELVDGQQIRRPMIIQLTY